MDSLIADLEQAQEGSRELDTGAAQAQGFDTLRGEMCIDGSWIDIPHYTTNLQDALGLAPEGCAYIIEFWPDTGASAAVVFIGSDKPTGSVYAATPALALTIAALKARREA